MEIISYTNSYFDELILLLKKTNLYYEDLDKKEIFEKKIAHDSESILIAKNEQKIIGTVFIIFDPWQSFIYHLGVDPEFQNQGTGSLLMKKAEKILKERGCLQPTLFVEEENSKVIDFYKKKGWFVLYNVACLEKKL